MTAIVEEIAMAEQSINQPTQSIWLNTLEKQRLMSTYINRKLARRGCFDNLHGTAHIASRTGASTYDFVPASCDSTQLREAAKVLQYRMIVCLSNTHTKKLLQETPPLTESVMLTGIRGEVRVHTSIHDLQDSLPVVPTLRGCAFIRELEGLLIWHGEVEDVISYVELLEDHLVATLWKFDQYASGETQSKQGMIYDYLTRRLKFLVPGKPRYALARMEKPHEMTQDSTVALKDGMLETVYEVHEDIEANSEPSQRTFAYFHSAMMIVVILLEALTIGQSSYIMLHEFVIDGLILRFAYAVFWPVAILLTAYLVLFLCIQLMWVMGPLGQLDTNSQHFSAIPQPRITNAALLPMITIHMPVYKEDFEKVLEPSLRSILKAVQMYESIGGIVNIVMCEDGLQLLDDSAAQVRKDFYHEHGIGYTSRPAHTWDAKTKTGFERHGRFKKASNMNHCIEHSLLYAQLLTERYALEPWSTSETPSTVMAAIHREVETVSDGICHSSGDIRLGDILLLVDSDTRVPLNCLVDAAAEFSSTNSPEIGLIQCSGKALTVINNFFEYSLARFFEFVIFVIAYLSANGAAAPCIGHNCFLRVKAMFDVAETTADGRMKWWSEEHVSEDLFMVMQMQNIGWKTRVTTYGATETGWREGVSLTVEDEIRRWQKYAFGANEVIFNPLKYWFVRGPIAKSFLRYIFKSKSDFASRMAVVAYLTTYWALGASIPLSLAAYFFLGWFALETDKIYQGAFGLWAVSLLVYTALPAVTLAILKYRRYEDRLFSGIGKNFCWLLVIMLLMSGMSFHVAEALMAQLIGVRYSFSATAKTLENTTFADEIPKILKAYKWMYLTCVTLVMMLLALAFAVPPLWQIRSGVAITPLAWQLVGHMIMPFLLNPHSYFSEIHV